MPAWLTILLVMGLVIAVLTPSRQQFAWFLRLRRPRWLTFERWIPLIWSLIYLCFYASALLRWRAGGAAAPLAMVGYLVLLVLVQSFTLLICRTRRLAWGTAAGLAGWIWGLGLTLALRPVSPEAALLLVPFLLWSPIGTFVTWRMQRLNR
ncbi:TspO/MBR family protein [Cyanobium gracile]|uniref:Tryptophan-rich sensory protein n=1 Tax=Cyanobium gracile (strain ATCC 27147 / PCC 6307) TaxID=292564 RepID=K9P4G0_CYAGP|nr:tryptophan-rich sensory protein [Cyanobium gracile]AFY27611.1 tryptophan-rich sensory protein [Cyanobium gracile PCC 6307]